MRPINVISDNARALVVAIEDYDHYPKLDKASAAASQLCRALSNAGIRIDFAERLKSKSSQEVARQLKIWFAEANENQHLFLYWASHGKVEADGLYLITKESPRTNLDQTNSVHPAFLAKSAANSRARKVLIVIDACFSGETLGEVIGTISKVLGSQAPNVGPRRGIAVLASAHALQQAQEGIICDLLKKTLTDAEVSRRWSDEDQFIDADRLFASIVDEIENRACEQRIVPATFGSTIELFPNPRYRAGILAEVVEERARHLALSDSLDHFELAARGIEVGESGWYFAGRAELLEALIKWLVTAEHGLRIVTGPRGAGKSAVLGRLATLSDPEFRKVAVAAGAVSIADRTLPPEGIIDVAIHAKGKTLDDCAKALTKAFQLGPAQEHSINIERVIADLGALNERIAIIIDALDEAVAGQRVAIARRLIIPLSRLAHVRVLVGVRRSITGAPIPEGEERHRPLRNVFGIDAIIDDLEDQKATRADIAEYVRRRLHDSPRHANNATGIVEAADRVATRAGDAFLYARIVSRTLQESDVLDIALPETAEEAFSQDLSARFGVEERRVDDLLEALAWGEGKGLTRRVWPLVANAISIRRRTYDDNDIGWVLEHAGWYIIEDGIDGQAVYRLNHQALVDNYRSKLNAAETQSRIVRAVTRGIEAAGWLDCDRYLARHLADHAAKGGCLGALLKDPGYLAVADPARLLATLPRIREGEERRIADIYGRVAHRLFDQSALDRMPLIHMTAQLEAPELATSLAPPVPTRWVCRWARARPTSPHRIVGRDSARITSLALGNMDGHVLVVSGAEDGTIRLWNADTGEAIGRPLLGHVQAITSLAFDLVDNRPILVSASEDPRICLWDVRAGELIGNPIVGHWINSVALGHFDNRAVAISGSTDWRILQWDLRTGSRVEEFFAEHSASVRAVAFGFLDGHPVVISGSEDGYIQLRDARTGAPIGRRLFAEAVNSVALVTQDSPAVLATSDGGKIYLWDARTAEQQEVKSIEWQSSSVMALGKLIDRLTLANVHKDKAIHVWDLITTEVRKPLEGHADVITALALSTVNERPVIVSASMDQTIRLWNFDSEAANRTLPEAHADVVSSVALSTFDTRPAVTSGSYDRTIRVWDAHTGEQINPARKAHTERITSVASLETGRGSILASGSYDGTVRLWYGSEHMATAHVLEWSNAAVTAVALGVLDSGPIVVSGRSNGAISAWDGSRRKLIKEAGFRQNAVTCLVLSTIDKRLVLVSARENDALRLRDASTGRRMDELLKPQATFVRVALTEIGYLFIRVWDSLLSLTRRNLSTICSVAFGYIEGRPVLVSGGADADIRLWDGRTAKQISKPLIAHTERVTGVALSTLHGYPVIISGSADQTLRVWDAKNHDMLFAIPFGTAVTSLDYRPDVGLAVGLHTGIIMLEFPRDSLLMMNSDWPFDVELLAKRV